MKRAKLFLLLFVASASLLKSQEYTEGDIALTGSIGAPHLFKGIVKAATGTEVFKSKFSGKLEVSEITGMNPIAVKAEYGIQKWLGLGISYSTWNMEFAITDYYNVLKAGAVTQTDEIDTYKFKVTSSSFGIRPNLRIPIKNRKHDVYFGLGLGITKNSLNVDFSSTDVNKVLPNFDYDLSLPGGFYFAPTLGYRLYFIENLGLNLEVGYEKGAIVQGGLVIRFNTK